MKTKRGQKWLYGVVILAVCCMLTGCHMSHEWQEATCTEPKTCTAGGETEGEALGHTWVDATCAAPKTCSVCGETEGEALVHTWVDATCSEAKHCSICGETEGEPLEHTLTEANYQQAAICEVCGKAVGDMLTPAFEEYNVKGQFMELAKTYDYVTCCYDDTNYKTVGQATVTDYQTFTSDDTHEEKEGYEWKTVTLQIVYSDENAQKYGFQTGFCTEDYYDITGHDDSMTYDDEGVGTYTVNWNGQDHTECKAITGGNYSGWTGDTFTVTYEYESLLPAGYDGGVVGLFDASVPLEDGMYIYNIASDDALFFRLD